MKERGDIFLYRPSASRLKDIISPTGKESAAATAYMNDILRWTFFGKDEYQFSSFWSERGDRLEPAALLEYVKETGIETEKPAKYVFNKEELCGCYPDGVSEFGCVEIKCLKKENHQDIIKNGVPAKFKPQIQGTLLITKKDWIDFIAYNPGEELYLKRFHRDEDYLSKMIKLLASFNEQLEQKYAQCLAGAGE